MLLKDGLLFQWLLFIPSGTATDGPDGSCLDCCRQGDSHPADGLLEEAPFGSQAYENEHGGPLRAGCRGRSTLV